jgi:hypothetical protein
MLQLKEVFISSVSDGGQSKLEWWCEKIFLDKDNNCFTVSSNSKSTVLTGWFHKVFADLQW